MWNRLMVRRNYLPDAPDASNGETAPVDADGIPDIAPSTDDGFLGWPNRSDTQPSSVETPLVEDVPAEEAPVEAEPPQTETTTPPEEAPEQPAAEETAVPESETQEAAEATEAEPPPKAVADPDSVKRLLARYGNQIEEVGSAYLHLQGKEGRTVAEVQALKEQLDSIATVDPEGKLVVRPEAAARALNAQRGKREDSPPPAVSEKDIRASVHAEFVEKLSDDRFGGPAEVEDNLRVFEDQIETVVQDRLKAAQQQQMAAQMQEAARISQSVNRFYEKHPDAGKYDKQIDSWYARFPEHLRAEILDYLPLEEVFQAERLKAQLPQIIEETWAEALKHAQQNVTPTDGGTPTGGARAPRALAASGPDNDVPDDWGEPQGGVLDRLFAAK